MVKEITTLIEYCQNINIPEPRHTEFDIRRFEDNMRTVKQQVAPFRHHFFAIALKLAGSGVATTGFSKTDETKPCLFFNSPYQITSWDIAPDWKGYYIIFTENFLKGDRQISSYLYNFSFLRMDKAIPFMVEQEDVELLAMIYEKIFQEYHSNNKDSFDFIWAYLNMLLLYVRRSYDKAIVSEPGLETTNRKGDISLVTRFQTLIEISFYPLQENHYPHSVEFYADKLALHPNHLNAIVKRVTGKTALQLIQAHIITLAKSALSQTGLSIKEVAYGLYFKEPTHFSSFFKKLTKQTPAQFRAQSGL
jgi:AraC-like DNA-binding protein